MKSGKTSTLPGWRPSVHGARAGALRRRAGAERATPRVTVAATEDMRLWSFGDCDRRFPYVNTDAHKECVRVVGSPEARDARALRVCEVSHEADREEIDRCKAAYTANKEKAAQDGVVANAPATAQAPPSRGDDAPGQGDHDGGRREQRAAAAAVAAPPEAERRSPQRRRRAERESSSSMPTIGLALLLVGRRRLRRQSRSRRKKQAQSALAGSARPRRIAPERAGRRGRIAAARAVTVGHAAGLRSRRPRRRSPPEPARDPLASFSGFLRRRRTALRHDVVLPVSRAEPADLLLAAEGAALLHAAHARPVRRRARAGLSRALFRPLHAPRTARSARARCRTSTCPDAIERIRRINPERAVHRARAQSADDAAVVSPADAVPAAGGRAGLRAGLGARARARARRARADAIASTLVSCSTARSRSSARRWSSSSPSRDGSARTSSCSTTSRPIRSRVYRRALEFLDVDYDGQTRFESRYESRMYRYRWLQRMLFVPAMRGGKMMATLQQRTRKYNPDGSKRPSLIKRVTRWNKIPASPVAADAARWRTPCARHCGRTSLLLSRLLGRDLSGWLAG